MSWGGFPWGAAAWGGTSSESATPTPSTIAGTGTVQTPVGVVVARPSVFTGTGTVQIPLVGGVSPAVITGTGTVLTPLVVVVARPSVVPATGLVNSPAINLPTGVINSTGTVFTPLVTATDTGPATIIVLLSGLPTSVTLEQSSAADVSAIGASSTVVESSADWAVITV